MPESDNHAYRGIVADEPSSAAAQYGLVRSLIEAARLAEAEKAVRAVPKRSRNRLSHAAWLHKMAADCGEKAFAADSNDEEIIQCEARIRLVMRNF